MPAAGKMAGPEAAEALSGRTAAGLAGVLLSAMMAGFNNRVGSLALPDIRGALGLGVDDASWLTTTYSAGELIAMPFAAWFGITLSVRRCSLWTLGFCAVLALALPLIRNLDLMLALRFLQGTAAGASIPLLMMAALKYLPAPIRLHGLALYALTATLAPNLSTWLAGHWTDGWLDWRWVYWQTVPLAAIAGLLSAWGLPREPIQPERFRQANWPGMACGAAALGLIAVALDQGSRLDWLQSKLIGAALLGGIALLIVYLQTEWYHASPFIRLRILRRRNLGLGFIIFVLLLVTLASSSLLPALYLGSIQEYRPRQVAPLALIIALPQPVLGSAVALLLYLKWVDARLVLAAGLALIATACFWASQLSSEWGRDQFVAAQTLHAFGQPMAVVSMLFLATSVVQPREGAYVSGLINTLRALGSLAAASGIGQFVIVRSRFHAEMLLDHASLKTGSLPRSPTVFSLASVVDRESLVLSIGDAFLLLGALAAVLAALALMLDRIPAPEPRVPSASPLHPPSADDTP